MISMFEKYIWINVTIDYPPLLSRALGLRYLYLHFRQYLARTELRAWHLKQIFLFKIRASAAGNRAIIPFHILIWITRT